MPNHPVMIDGEITTNGLKELQRNLERAEDTLRRIGIVAREAQIALILNSEWASLCDAVLDRDGSEWTLWPQQLMTYNEYIDMGNGIHYYNGQFKSDTFEEMASFVNRMQFRSVTLNPIYQKVLETVANSDANISH